MGWLEDAGGFIGDVVAVPLGLTGAAGGGIAGLATGQGLDGFSQGWTAGASFAPAGSLGADARARVRDTYARFEASNAPEWAKFTLTAAGPPQTAGQAWAGLALSAALPVGAARVAAQGGRPVIGNFLARFGVRAAPRAAGTAVRSAASTAATSTLRMTTGRKILAGLGLGALGFEVLNPEGNNPLIPDFLEKPAEAAGDAATMVAKILPYALVAAGVVAAVVVLRPRGAKA